MKKLVALLIVFISFSAYSQDPYLQNSNPNAEEQAEVITDEYIPELGLTGKQILLFQKKVEEFLLRRYKVEADFSGKEKLDMLYQLQQEETAEMKDILTRLQMDVYKDVKLKIQPLETVEVETVGKE